MALTSRKFRYGHEFEFDSLPRNSAVIRLLKVQPGEYGDALHCQLRHFDLGQKSLPQFFALSYRWGELYDKRWMWVNRKKFCIQPTVRDALKAIRRSNVSLFIWIDAVCIDQTNLREKMLQVGMMGRIFGQAELVVAWLGTVKNDGDYVLECLKSLAVHPPAELSQMTLESERFQASLTALSDDPYWTRAWIRQELLLAKSIHVHTNSLAVSWNQLTPLMPWTIHKANGGTKAGILKRDIKYYGQEGPFLKLWWNRELAPVGNCGLDLATLIHHYGDAQCKDVRDRVYALLAVAKDWQVDKGLDADYEIPTYLLFLALMQYCNPENATSFGRTLATVLQVRPLEIDYILNRGEVYGQPGCLQKLRETHKSKTGELAFAFCDKVRLEFAKYQQKMKQDDNMREICRALAMLPAEEDDWIDEAKMIRIERTKFSILLRPALAGYYWSGMYQDIVEGDISKGMEPVTMSADQIRAQRKCAGDVYLLLCSYARILAKRGYIADPKEVFRIERDFRRSNDRLIPIDHVVLLLHDVQQKPEHMSEILTDPGVHNVSEDGEDFAIARTLDEHFIKFLVTNVCTYEVSEHNWDAESGSSGEQTKTNLRALLSGERRVDEGTDVASTRHRDLALKGFTASPTV